MKDTRRGEIIGLRPLAFGPGRLKTAEVRALRAGCRRRAVPHLFGELVNWPRTARAVLEHFEAEERQGVVIL